MANLINNNIELNQVINNPQVSSFRKKELVADIFSGKVNEDLISFVNILVSKKRIHTLNGILTEIENIYLEKNNTVIAHVKTVIPLNETEKKNLVSKLEAKYN